ncbi:ABC transporter permease [Shouchella clausii]|uniref:ABC transporter permease n=1 Tax=Shouchella clausii TaxID=79880 RepID=UPI00280A9C92|nr:ABC transporter permease [Shouchella clausii]WMM32540.1 ABC transporter permease [Shouchella clausii]
METETQLATNPSPKRPDKKENKAKSPWATMIVQLIENKLSLIGLIIIICFLLLALLAPYLTPYSFAETNSSIRLLPPSGDHWFGTDDLGRDVFTRVAYGARISLLIGFFAVTGAMVVGTLLGLIAGFYGKWVDMLLSRVFDVMLAFPSILLAIAIVAILGPSLSNAMLAIAIINVPIFARLVRSKVISLKQEEFVMAARAQGMKNGRLLFHHILPNSMAPIIVQATLGFGVAIIEAAALGFLGMGASPPTPEWGKMLADSRGYIQNAYWSVLFPGLSIMLVVLGFNMIGDGLRDALDPKMKGK